MAGAQGDKHQDKGIDTDKGRNRDSNYIYGPSLPRSYYVGVKVNY